MLVEMMPGTAVMAGQLPFDMALGSIFVVALVAVLAIGVVTEVVGPKSRDLGATIRRSLRATRRLASATARP